MNNCIASPSLLFETSWEVCNKIGGIYTVLSTKAATLHKILGDKLIFIGPDVWTPQHPSPWFTESKTVMADWRRSARLPEGVEVRVGRWTVPGRPIAILVKFDSLYASKNELYGRMWERFGVDSLHAYGDYDEACAFSAAAAAVIESIVKHYKAENSAIAHFDEWTTGMGLLMVKDRLPGVSTVFTTHATSIGRSICGNGKPLYDYLHAYNGDQMACELNMQSKHSLEKAAAHEADCFTTVSEVTARECAQLLEREPDVVTPNGFEDDFVPGRNRYKAARQAARDCMLKVASALTGREYADDTFIIATSGRCEYRNKGLDMMLDAMHKMAETETGRDILAFVMVPAWSAGARADLVEALASGSKQGLVDPVVTHWLHNPDDDPVIRRIRQLGFNDRNSGSRVDVVYVPCYLNGDDGIFNMKYYDLLPGLDATVFPSYYEPWGYTPLESVAFGVPTVTTSLSGFGQWVRSLGTEGFATSGVEVVDRTDSNYDQATAEIAAALLHLAVASAKTATEVRRAARVTASLAAWESFTKYYETAYCKAIEKNKQL